MNFTDLMINTRTKEDYEDMNKDKDKDFSKLINKMGKNVL